MIQRIEQIHVFNREILTGVKMLTAHDVILISPCFFYNCILKNKTPLFTFNFMNTSFASCYNSLDLYSRLDKKRVIL